MKNIRLSVTIMAHPKRRTLVKKLRKQLDVPHSVVWDQINNVWDTGRRALLAYNPNATHHLVLQDDCIPAKHLGAACRKLLQFVPNDHPVCLYMGKARYIPNKYRMASIATLARKKKASFAVFEGPWWGPGIIVPTHLINDVVSFGDNHTEIPQYDHKISQFFTRGGVHCYYTVPSLVDHNTLGTDSLLGRGNGHGRKSVFFAGTARSAAFHRWNNRIVTPKHLPSAQRRSFPASPEYPAIRSIIVPPGITKVISSSDQQSFVGKI